MSSSRFEKNKQVLNILLEKNNLAPDQVKNNAPKIECRDPCTQKYLGAFRSHTPFQVQEAVNRARKAQISYGKTTFKQRKQLLRTLLDFIISNQKEICFQSAQDSGKTMTDAQMGELFPVCEKIRWHLLHGEKFLSPEPREGSFLSHKIGWIEYSPIGVCGIICPWNFPFHNIFCPLIPVLFAGNGAVIKVSEWTTWSVTYYSSIIHKCLEKCGLSKDLVQFVVGFGQTGAALVSSDIDKIFFTGSPQNGRKVAIACAKLLKPCVLELGGKDPMIICEDADFDQAVSSALLGTLTSAGQMCVSSERIYVHEKIYDRFIQALQQKVDKIRQGPTLAKDPVDMGSMTMPHQLVIIQQLVDDAVSKGARLVSGGKPNPKYPNGQFYLPTILADVNHSMKIMSEEHFGPVIVLHKFSSDKQVIKLANDCPYGLGGSVFSKNLSRAHSIAQRLSTGMVVINDYGIAYMFQSLPFGGVRISGVGKINGREGLRSCANVKSIVSDRVPGVRIPVISAFQYPVDNVNAFPLAENMIKMIYSQNGMKKPLYGAKVASYLLANKFRNVPKL